jgi:hypothetical protein
VIQEELWQEERLFEDIGACFFDAENDGDLDLYVVSGGNEYKEGTDGLQDRLYLNEGNGRFRKDQDALPTLRISGSCVKPVDFDGDGDMDLVAGNLGLNYKYKASGKEPFEVYTGDFDQNNRKDIIFAYYQDGRQYPVVDRIDLVSAIPALEKKFPTNDPYSLASLNEIFGDAALDSAVNYKAYTFASSYIENLGNNKFRITPLNNYVQISSHNAILIEDVDQDSHLDIIMAGNLYASEVEVIRNDAGIGIFLIGDGKGNFQPIPFQKSGLYADGDIKKMKWINSPTGKILVLARNSDYLKLIRLNQKKFLAEVRSED